MDAGMEATILSTGGGSPIRSRGEAKSTGPGGGRLYAFTGFADVDSSSDGIEDGGGGGVVCRLVDLSRNSVGEGGADFVVVDRSLLSAVAGGCGRASRGGGTVGGGNLPDSAIVGETVVVWVGKPADLSSSILCTTGSASSYNAKP